MAAYAALASLINLMEDIQNHPRLSTSFDHRQLRSLRENLDFLLNFVEGQQKEVEDLECQIASEVHAAEDAIESYIVDLIHSGSTADEVEDVKSRLQNATEALESIKKTIMEIETERGIREKLPEYSSTRSDRISKTTMVGFDDESIQLMRRLIQPEPNQQVIPIVGMGGTGKTTLARFVYEHSHITHRFDIRMWASISQQPRMENILSELLFGEKFPTTQTVNELGEMLHKMLWGRRYLIILDDIWSIETLHEIQLFLPDNGCGDRVVITTRLSNMAAFISSIPFEIKLLDEEKGWRLFCAKVFGEEERPPELEEIGREIVRKCKGLALSIVVIGGHLGKSSRMKLYWESVRDDINSVLDSGEDQCSSILSLSYNHLPAHLKPCFLYTGIFEEDEVIYASNLINMWVDEGLVKADEEKSKEEIAEECFKELFDRNLVLIDMWDDFGKYYSCKIHDLLRELSIRVARKENFFSAVFDTTQTVFRERRVAIHKDIEPETMFDGRPLIRSLKCEGSQLSSKFRLLRVVIDRVEVVLNGGLLEPHFQHVNLRHLDCHFVQPENAASEGNSMPTLHLPPSISLIWNLQTLQISASAEIVAPAEIWKMTQLRCLDVNRLHLPEPCTDDPVLGHLHILGQVLNLSLSEDVCKRIPNIKKLDLCYDYQGESGEESIYYYPQIFGCFHKLESFSCSIYAAPSWYHSAQDLTFPSSLQRLTLINFPLHWDDLAMISSLPRLLDLVLYNSCHGPEWNPVKTGFPRLRFLRVDDCRSLVSWNAESSHFPVLEYAYFVDAICLDEIPSSIGDIPTLKCITLYNCSDSAAISAASILVEQQEFGNDGLRVEVIITNKEKLESFREMLREEDLTCNNLYLKDSL